MRVDRLFGLVVLVLSLALVFMGLFAGVHRADAKQALLLEGDMVRGSQNPTGPVCALTSRFKQGEMVVWRTRIIDAETGKAVPVPVEELLAKPPSKEELEAMSKDIKVVVHMSDGQTFPMHFHAHTPKTKTDYFWTISWVIPKDYPTGTMDYTITVDWPAQGKTARWAPFNVDLSKLTIEAANEQPAK